jgi:hypothetical protein
LALPSAGNSNRSAFSEPSTAFCQNILTTHKKFVNINYHLVYIPGYELNPGLGPKNRIFEHLCKFFVGRLYFPCFFENHRTPYRVYDDLFSENFAVIFVFLAQLKQRNSPDFRIAISHAGYNDLMHPVLGKLGVSRKLPYFWPN